MHWYITINLANYEHGIQCFDSLFVKNVVQIVTIDHSSTFLLTGYVCGCTVAPATSAVGNPQSNREGSSIGSDYSGTALYETYIAGGEFGCVMSTRY